MPESLIFMGRFLSKTDLSSSGTASIWPLRGNRRHELLRGWRWEAGMGPCVFDIPEELRVMTLPDFDAPSTLR